MVAGASIPTRGTPHPPLALGMHGARLAAPQPASDGRGRGLLSPEWAQHLQRANSTTPDVIAGGSGQARPCSADAPGGDAVEGQDSWARMLASGDSTNLDGRLPGAEPGTRSLGPPSARRSEYNGRRSPSCLGGMLGDPRRPGTASWTVKLGRSPRYWPRTCAPVVLVDGMAAGAGGALQNIPAFLAPGVLL